MGKKAETILDRLLFRRALSRWRRVANQAAKADLAELRGLRQRARQVRREIDRLLFTAEARLTLPLIGNEAMRKPAQADWSWRPDFWKGPISPPGLAAAGPRSAFGPEAMIYHDCQVSEITARQVRNTRAEDLAPFGLRLDVFRFDGSFLSLVIELPESAAQTMRMRHLVCLGMVVETEKPLELFARLNIRNGPNVEQMVRELHRTGTEVLVEFDLAYSKINERRVDRAWVDLIFEGPSMNQILIRDLTFYRRPRAEL